MLITFSEAAILKAGAPLDMEGPVFDTAESVLRPGAVMLSWARGREVRFTLPGATTEQHDQVIRALLTLDPHAKVRTARAVYQGLADYDRQYQASL